MCCSVHLPVLCTVCLYLPVLSTHLLPAGEVDRPGRGLADELVDEADVGEGAARHHCVVTSPRPVRVELTRNQAETQHKPCLTSHT